MTATDQIEINETFELAFRFVTETNENIFLTGKAGTGKTTFLKYLKEHCSKNIIVAAPTGVAAINAGGVTLHSLFQLPFHPFVPSAINRNELLQKLRFTRRRIDLLRSMDLLVIDEISMVRCDTMDAIDTILRHVRRRHDEPFGGVQLLCIGDLFQLPPVAPHRDWILLQEYYQSEFFFDSLIVREQLPVLIELDKIFRQKNDSFIAVLNKVRNNEMMPEDFDELHLRYQPGFSPGPDEQYITLTSHNAQADKINNAELNRLWGDKKVYQAEVKNEFPESMFPADEMLELKEGAQVMFLKNDPEKRYFNGKIGRIRSLETDEIVVETDEGDITVGRDTWENLRYTLSKSDGKLEQEVLGTFSQFPLRLAWAITIHKSQGLTFDRVMIDAGAAFSSGQVYVALSRCRSLEGIVLLSRIPPSAILSNDSVVQSHHSMRSRVSLPERFEGARKAYTMQLMEEVFSFRGIADAIRLLHYRITERQDKLSGDPVQWLHNLQSEFSEMKAVGDKFVGYTYTFFQEEPVIEKNQPLQKRISDAANHFSGKLSELGKILSEHPLLTEHLEVARDVDEYLTQTELEIARALHQVEFCKSRFSVSDFLKHRLAFSAPRASLSVYAGSRKQQVSDVANPELYETLRRWRDMICQDYDLPIYMVANKASLSAIAEYLPLQPKDLMKIPGFGKAKTERFGDDILDIVRDYCEKHQLEGNIEDLPDRPKKKETKSKSEKIPTTTVTYNLFRSGKTIEEIAKERGMVASTIEGHIARCIGEGRIQLAEVLSDELQKQINSVADTLGWENMAALKSRLPAEISFGQILMARAASVGKEG